jgi:hypothetical protein
MVPPKKAWPYSSRADQFQVQVDEGAQLAHLGRGQGSAGTRAARGGLLRGSRTMTWLSHSEPCGVRMNGTLPSGEQDSTASSLLPGTLLLEGHALFQQASLTLL